MNGIYLGYNPLTNLLLTSWDMKVLFMTFLGEIYHVTSRNNSAKMLVSRSQDVGIHYSQWPLEPGLKRLNRRGNGFLFLLSSFANGQTMYQKRFPPKKTGESLNASPPRNQVFLRDSTLGA